MWRQFWQNPGKREERVITNLTHNLLFKFLIRYNKCTQKEALAFLFILSVWNGRKNRHMAWMRSEISRLVWNISKCHANRILREAFKAFMNKACLTSEPEPTMHTSLKWTEKGNFPHVSYIQEFQCEAYIRVSHFLSFGWVYWLNKLLESKCKLLHYFVMLNLWLERVLIRLKKRQQHLRYYKPV